MESSGYAGCTQDAMGTPLCATLTGSLQQPVEKLSLPCQQSQSRLLDGVPTTPVDFRHFQLPARARRPLDQECVAALFCGLAIALKGTGGNDLSTVLFQTAKFQEGPVRHEARPLN